MPAIYGSATIAGALSPGLEEPFQPPIAYDAIGPGHENNRLINGHIGAPNPVSEAVTPQARAEQIAANGTPAYTYALGLTWDTSTGTWVPTTED